MSSSAQDGLSRADDQVNSLQHFQQHSRLHFIGQWKTRMHDEFQVLFAEHPEWNHGHLSSQVTFIHVDLDAFFCSVQLAKKENEHLRGSPVGIAAGRFNSDISSCNYVARARGIRAGMYVNAARELCPELVILRYDLPACEHVTKTLYRLLFDAFASAHPPVKMSLEVYSIDEVMIATDSSDYDVLRGICERVRGDLHRSTGCTASCGIAPNIMLARLATRQAKPDGIRCISRAEVPTVMQALPFRDIHGAGQTTRRKVMRVLREQGVLGAAKTGGSLAKDASHGDIARIQGGGFPSTAATPGEAFARGGHGKNTNAEGDAEEEGDDLVSNDEDDGDGDDGDLVPSVILCSHVQKLKREDLQAALGKKAGDTFYNLCRGDDYRLVRRTGDLEDQKAMGKTVPVSVGCSMNYAVRPRCLDDVWSIVKQLVEEVSAKMKRVDAVAQSIRVTVLERHPFYPKEPQKYMGRGPCVEAHIPVKFPHALDGNATELMCEAVREALAPLMVMKRALSNEERGTQLGLTNRPSDTQVIWTVTLSSLQDVLVEDLRGMTIQATGLRPRLAEGPAALGRKREREAEGQMTLAAAFSKGSKRPGAKNPIEDVDAESLDVAASVDSVTQSSVSPVIVERGPPCILPARTAASGGNSIDGHAGGDGNDDSSSTVPITSMDEDTKQSHAATFMEGALHTTPRLFHLFQLGWCERYEEIWKAMCSEACSNGDIPLVKALLRCAVSALVSIPDGARCCSESLECSNTGSADVVATITRLEALVRDALDGWAVDYA